MYYVYILKFINFPEKIYVGYTINLQRRFAAHNSGGSVHTDRSCKLVTYLRFADKIKASELEKYLKSQSGRAFMHKRLIFNET